MTGPIARRSFLQGGIGVLGLGLAGGCDRHANLDEIATDQAKAWEGYGGVGQYASSHGNMWSVVDDAHTGIRDGARAAEIARAFQSAAEESVDVLVVGSGISGLTAIHQIREQSPNARILLLDNNPMFGGESKQNDFEVNDVRLSAPQGASGFGVEKAGTFLGDFYRKIGLADHYEYAPSPASAPMEFDRSNFGFMFKSDISENFGWFFDTAKESVCIRNIWSDDLKRTPFTAGQRESLLRWRSTEEVPFKGSEEAQDRWLDGMSYRTYLMDHLKLDPVVLSYIDPIIGVDFGIGVEASAFAAKQYAYPGFLGMGAAGATVRRYADLQPGAREAFPGGNSGIARHILKAILPDAIEGEARMNDIIRRPLRLDRLDKRGESLRLRQAATVLAVRPRAGGGAEAVYSRDSRLYRVQARAIVMATGSWVNKHVCTDLPTQHRAVMDEFCYAPVLVANVALTNWRFMERRGVTACRWFGGEFGFSGNIRRPMVLDGNAAPLTPDQPIVLTLYAPWSKPNLPLRERGAMGRADLFATSAATLEGRLRRQLAKLFGPAGFDAKRDIAAIVFNRWGHAYSTPWPGFYFGKKDVPPVKETLGQPIGPVVFAHSEISGKQTWAAAAEQGARAGRQVLQII